MSTFVGRPAVVEPAQIQEHRSVPEPKAVQEAPAEKVDFSDMTRAELVEEAEELGIKVPKNANKAQIAKLIEEAPVM